MCVIQPLRKQDSYFSRSFDLVVSRCLALQFLPRFDISRSSPLFVPHALLPALITGTTTDEAAVMTTFVPPLRDPRMAQSAAAQAVGRVAAERCLSLVEPPPPGVPATTTSLILPGLKRRLKQAFCQPGNVRVNPLLEIFKAVVLPELAPGGTYLGLITGFSCGTCWFICDQDCNFLGAHGVTCH